MISTLICKTPDCSEPCKAKGLCSKHYYQQRDVARAAKSAAGQVCHYCRKPSQGKYTCSECTQKKSVHEARKRDHALLRGRCVYSGCPEQHLQGKKLCQVHQDQQTHYYVTHKADYGPKTPERRTVIAHLSCIHRNVSTYAGMPFFDGWNPKTGGSIAAGEQWIEQNLGRRPGSGYQLHIVDRILGFVPDNLVWVPCSQHRRQEMIYKLLLEVKTLKDRLAKYESS